MPLRAHYKQSRRDKLALFRTLRGPMEPPALVHRFLLDTPSFPGLALFHTTDSRRKAACVHRLERQIGFVSHSRSPARASRHGSCNDAAMSIRRIGFVSHGHSREDRSFSPCSDIRTPSVRGLVSDFLPNIPHGLARSGFGCILVWPACRLYSVVFISYMHTD